MTTWILIGVGLLCTGLGLWHWNKPKFRGLVMLNTEMPNDWDTGVHRYTYSAWEIRGKIRLFGAYRDKTGIALNHNDFPYSTELPEWQVQVMAFLEEHKPLTPAMPGKWLYELERDGYVEELIEVDQDIDTRHSHYSWIVKV